MRWYSRLAVACVLPILAASTVPAATVSYTLDTTGPAGTFNLYADASLGDNFGIAGYGIGLAAASGTAITSLDHKSVNAPAASGPSGIGPAGFTLFRTADNVTNVSGFQDTVGAANLIRAIGQTSGSLASNGIASFTNPVEGDPWGSHFLIASGTYTGPAGGLRINTLSNNTYANVFSGPTGSLVSGANVAVYNNGNCVDCVAPVIQSAVYDNINSANPATLTHQFSVASSYPVTYSGLTFDSYAPAPGVSGNGPAFSASAFGSPPTFNWKPFGSPLGTYKWHITGTNQWGTSQGDITVNVTTDDIALTPAVVTYTLDFTGPPGTFKLYADSSAGNNFGIAGYSVQLTGPITTLDHSSVNTLASSGPTGVGPAGFTLLRSADNVTDVFALQDTLGSSANLIHGIGQNAGSLAASGITSFITPVEGDPWPAHFLIASGTYTGPSSRVGINASAALANVFTAQTGSGAGAAQIQIVRSDQFLPEPATLSLVSLALFVGAGTSRRRAD